jgi:hypothetical protein
LKGIGVTSRTQCPQTRLETKHLPETKVITISHLGVAALLALTLVAAQPAQAQTADFNFDTDIIPTQGKPTPFTDTINGLQATFSSPGDPGAFDVTSVSSFFLNLTGNALSNSGATKANYLPLDITFSHPVSSITLNFATLGSAGTPFYLTAFTGAINSSVAGSTLATGTVPKGYFFPEGLVTLTVPTGFDSVVFSSPASGMAVDNIIVTETAPVPEASSVVSLGLLLALGGGALVVSTRRRNAQTAT